MTKCCCSVPNQTLNSLANVNTGMLMALSKQHHHHSLRFIQTTGLNLAPRFLWCMVSSQTNKEATYTRFLRSLDNLATSFATPFRPESILTDFELGSINAFKTVYPNAQKTGCYFHHTQCIWKHIQENRAIVQKYKDKSNPDFVLKLRQLAALAFIPTPNVVSSFDILMGTPFFEENESILSPLTDYFEDVWIGRPRRRGSRQPLFAHDLWNCFQSTADGLKSTLIGSTPIHLEIHRNN